MKTELTIMERLQAPTPSLFKKLQAWGVSIAFIVAGLVAAQTKLQEAGVVFPDVVAKILEFVGVAAAAIAGVSTLPYDETKLKKKKA